ncbi:MAG: exonuclease subunit SbcD [Spirochaetia bacterium]|nr:exonuclease subunit SbcD [Spirochaetia bacterium]
MKILHTSDWHLGRNLYTKKRYEEFTLFLDWLVNTILEEDIDVLLIAGDVFDTTLPSHRSQELYYRFLYKVSTTQCHSVVIIGGNHDSPSFLDAPKALLETLNVFVVGAMREEAKEEVIILKDKTNIPTLIVCAVPYLRDKDIRTAESGETIEDKNSKLILGIKNHYEKVCLFAEQKQKELFEKHHLTIPIIAMGHLFSAGGTVTTGDGVRDLYVGSLGYVHEEIFPSSIDYLALGHLHSEQKVGGKEHFRYSGSPIPMGFSEAKEQKKVLIISFEGGSSTVEQHPIPLFQPLVRLVGSLEEIQHKIDLLISEKSNAWIEIELGKNINAKEAKVMLEQQIEASSLSIIRIKDTELVNSLLHSSYKNETLDDVDEYEVFERLLTAAHIEDEEREELIQSYKEIMFTIDNDDTLKE